MSKVREFLMSVLNFFGIMSKDQQISITNIATILFITITGFRALFGTLHLQYGDLVDWIVQPIDFASTLPLLYSLLNYANKRIETNKITTPGAAVEEKKNNEIVNN